MNATCRRSRRVSRFGRPPADESSSEALTTWIHFTSTSHVGEQRRQRPSSVAASHLDVATVQEASCCGACVVDSFLEAVLSSALQSRTVHVDVATSVVGSWISGKEIDKMLGRYSSGWGNASLRMFQALFEIAISKAPSGVVQGRR
jgi:hypothetical protein